VGLNRENGITIVISSHLLSEIDKLVTHIGIINKGRMMFQGTLDALKEKQQQSVSVVFETGDEVKTREIIAQTFRRCEFSERPVYRARSSQGTDRRDQPAIGKSTGRCV
jgi:ABC-2 type transport system ATP-binding protein